MKEIKYLLHRLTPKTTLFLEVVLLQAFFLSITHLYRTHKGSTYYFCYDYLLLEDEKVLIVTWQPYMKR